YLTPVWVGFHNGDFDVFSGGGPASAALERLAEDGDTAPLSAAFLASGQGTTETTILSGGTIPPLAPGQVASAAFTLDGNASRNRYLSFASMVIPSNDAFVGNGDPKAIMVFDSNGNLQAAEYLVMGSMVYDAGTEVNDEVPMNTAFLGQGTPDTGVVQNGVVSVHPGFNARGTGGILDQPMFENADFTAAGYRIFRISIAPALELTAISRSGDTVNLAWSGGQAPYQLQRRSALDQGDWANTGGPLNTMAATAGTADPMAYFRVVNGAHPTAQSARYRVTFNSVWSAATHPLDFPSNPHFSGLIGVTHNSSFTMWAPGLNATPGIRNMAETGSKQPLQTEVQAAITAGSGQNLLSGGGIGNSPGIVTLVFDIAQSHPLVSLTSMIAPSPDWFVGVHDLNLFANGTWAGELTVPLLGYDAGTDSGTSYGSANAVTSPAQPIQRINRPPLVGSSPAVPLGTFTFTRLE
ncbi:MAG TPA: hypothetical protein DCY13_24820, partial [Verrucomicrobiales bacterium]|nr:hypothetical protein [Verrucomicrobiales bacterium]